MGKTRGPAWEVAARYSNMNLNDPNVRVMWNYILADLDQVDNAQAFTTRFQFDF